MAASVLDEKEVAGIEAAAEGTVAAAERPTVVGVSADVGVAAAR